MVRQERKKLEIETSGSEEDSCESSDVETYACPGKKEIFLFFSWLCSFWTADFGCDETV